jgi:hypothetical protein
MEENPELSQNEIQEEVNKMILPKTETYFLGSTKVLL